ncbi:GNAT family N-acetyltransferase [Paenibacillus oceani]|uniref:N-acetyltransferase family protein n=1 Tax=Paenibacillus oceani TaxID=2772510 RepID=A0A927C749_9BACL|nr:GNAT family N-acetyltransferase [Paenibacillus oceani]MBD2862603.1 N-acetyltransferase family protein [Paenibacillus oceani]
MILRIRPAVRQDLPKLLDIYNDAVIHSAATFDLTPQTLQERERWFAQFNERFPIIVAENESGVAGYCCLTPYRPKPAYQLTAELSIYLDTDCRGGGIGSVLLQHMIDMARDLGFHVLISGITGGNEASVRLHRKFGFTEAGVLREVGCKFNAWQDVYLYQLILERT